MHKVTDWTSQVQLKVSKNYTTGYAKKYNKNQTNWYFGFWTSRLVQKSVSALHRSSNIFLNLK